MPLKPPSEDAVAKALSILMTSMREENGQDFVLGDDNACKFLPIPELANNVDAVGLAKSCMVKRMDAFIARMQHLRNLVSPIHQLPLDILSIILDGFPVWSSSPGQTSLLDQVPSGLLEIAIGASERWKEMDFALSCETYEGVEHLLEAPTPALEALRVLVKYPSSSITMGPFTLSPGPPLKEPVLSRWAAVDQLLRILSNSPRLEHLSFVSLQPSSYEALSSSLSSTAEPIVLEHLQTLKVAGSGSKYNSALLLSTQFPQCKLVYLWDGLPALPTSYWDEEIWSPGNAQTARVLGLNASTTERRQLDILLKEDWISFKDQDDQLQEHLDLIIYRSDFSSLLPRIRSVLAAWDPLPEINLKVEEDSPLLSLVHWSLLLRSLHFRGSTLCRKAIRELRTQVTTSGLEWICPALSDVILEYDRFDLENADVDVTALRSLLEDQRWSNSGPEGLLIPQPSSFTVICFRLGCPLMWELGEQLTGITPSFTAVDD